MTDSAEFVANAKGLLKFTLDQKPGSVGVSEVSDQADGDDQRVIILQIATKQREMVRVTMEFSA